MQPVQTADSNENPVYSKHSTRLLEQTAIQHHYRSPYRSFETIECSICTLPSPAVLLHLLVATLIPLQVLHLQKPAAAALLHSPSSTTIPLRLAPLACEVCLWWSRTLWISNMWAAAAPLRVTNDQLRLAVRPPLQRLLTMSTPSIRLLTSSDLFPSTIEAHTWSSAVIVSVA